MAEVEYVEIHEAVAQFITRHPELSFEKFSLPGDRLNSIAAFLAADAIALLLRRYPNNSLDRRVSFLMQPDGSCEAIGDNDKIPTSTIVSEIGRFLWEEPWRVHNPTKPNLSPKKNWAEYTAFRQLNTDGKNKDTIVPRLVTWLFAALKVSPGLMYGYRARPSETGNELILEPFGKDERRNNGEKYKPWTL